MQCSLVKPGYECSFATATGCGFAAPSDTCQTVVDNCSGCDHQHDWESGSYCKMFASPSSKWAFGACNMATHVKREEAGKKKVNPLKASKRGGR